jgi:hypothetical protein
MGIETGYTGDPKLKSKGVNVCCNRQLASAQPGRDCTADCRAWGLMQIYWPPFGGVDWSRLMDPDYNIYIGVKVLATRYKECGSWAGASAAFFSGSCNLIGTVDQSTGTDDSEYQAALRRNMGELQQLGIGSGVTGSKDPKDPTTSTPDGGANTKGDGKTCVPGTPICIDTPTIDPTALVTGQITAGLGKGLVLILGAALLLVGVWSLAR